MQREILSITQYQEYVCSLVPGLLPTETLALANAVGHVVREPATAHCDVPAFTNSAMDGYAVRWADVSGTLPVTLAVVTDVPAGSPANPTLNPGECARIMTGAPMPDDADTVINVECTDGGAQKVIINELPRKGHGAHVRIGGEVLTEGSQVLEPGITLAASHVAGLAAVGVGAVTVSRKPRVAVVASGDELKPAGTVLERGQIYESNACYLVSRLTELGADVVHQAHITDDESAFADHMDQIATDVDLIVMSGGVSVGVFDVVRNGLVADGHSRFVTVRMQPGKPQGSAMWRGKTPVLGLPGNPLSAAVSCELFVRPVLNTFTGATDTPVDCVAQATTEWRSPQGKTQFVPAVLSPTPDGTWNVTPAHRMGSASHSVAALGVANALVMVPQDVTTVAVGDTVPVRLWS